MFDKSLLHNWALRIVLILMLFVIGFYFVIKPALNAKKLTQTEIAEIPNAQQIPEEITPEGVAALIKDNTPFLLINADDAHFQISLSPGPIRLIYYTTTLSFRSAQELVRKDRLSKPTSSLDAIKLNSQRLIGTPLEWQRLGLPFVKNPMPKEPQAITPRQLSEAIKDNVDLQIIDFRPLTPGISEITPFPNALRWMPHEALNNLSMLSKEKWIVLIGLSSDVIQPLAFEFFEKGYVLTTVLDGGYPAWVNATDR
ncbi:MAG: rhodanese-like domain-containing protein [Methylobacter sp.]